MYIWIFHMSTRIVFDSPLIQNQQIQAPVLFVPHSIRLMQHSEPWDIIQKVEAYELE